MFYHHHPIKDLLKVCHGVTGDPKRRGLPPNKKGSLPRKRRCVKSNKVWSRLKMFNFAADKFPLDYFPILANLFLICGNYLPIFQGNPLPETYRQLVTIGQAELETVKLRLTGVCHHISSLEII